MDTKITSKNEFSFLHRKNQLLIDTRKLSDEETPLKELTVKNYDLYTTTY